MMMKRLKHIAVAVTLAALAIWASIPLGGQGVERGKGAPVGTLLTSSNTSVCTAADLNETTLWTFNLPASTLNQNGKAIRIHAYGTFGANANTKVVRGYFGSTLAINGSSGSTTNNSNWTADGVVTRTGASAESAHGSEYYGGWAGAAATSITTPAENTANTIVVKITGQNGVATASDICISGVTVELMSPTQGLITGTGGQFANPMLGPDGTAAAPTYGFGSSAGDGFYLRAANNMDVTLAGNSKYEFSTNPARGMSFSSDMPLSWSSTTTGSGGPDIFLFRDGVANTLAQRNGVNAQTFRIYNTYTDASNYERASVGYASNTLVIGPEQAGTGASRQMKLSGTGATTSISFATAGSDRWRINGSNFGFEAVTDNAQDIGASGANRPRTIYAATSIEAGSSVIRWSAATTLLGTTDGNLLLRNNAGTDFSLLQFGGTTSSFPALKKSASNLIDFRLADDSAYASVRASTFGVQTTIGMGSGSTTLIAAAAPTISSGFGTTPSVVTPNGTASFTVNVGTGGVATSGVVGLPTAANGWNCFVNDLTAAAAHVAYNTRQTASTTTTATLENQTTSTGAAVAWAASDILRVSCFAY